MKGIFAILLISFLIFAFGCIGQNEQQNLGTSVNNELSKTNNEVINNQPTPEKSTVNEENIDYKTEKTPVLISEEDIPYIEDVPNDIDENFNSLNEV